MILGIVAYGVAKGVKVYDTFIQGAREGFLTVIRIMPTLIGLMVAVGIFKSLRFSGFSGRRDWKGNCGDRISW